MFLLVNRNQGESKMVVDFLLADSDGWGRVEKGFRTGNVPLNYEKYFRMVGSLCVSINDKTRFPLLLKCLLSPSAQCRRKWEL